MESKIEKIRKLNNFKASLLDKYQYDSKCEQTVNEIIAEIDRRIEILSRQ